MCSAPNRGLRSAARVPSAAAGGRRCRSRAHTRQRPRSDLCFQVSSTPRKARQARGVLSAYAGCARGQYCVQGPRTGQRLRRRVPPARTCMYPQTQRELFEEALQVLFENLGNDHLEVARARTHTTYIYTHIYIYLSYIYIYIYISYIYDM